MSSPARVLRRSCPRSAQYRNEDPKPLTARLVRRKLCTEIAQLLFRFGKVDDAEVDEATPGWATGLAHVCGRVGSRSGHPARS